MSSIEQDLLNQLTQAEAQGLSPEASDLLRKLQEMCQRRLSEADERFASIQRIALKPIQTLDQAQYRLGVIKDLATPPRREDPRGSD